MIHLEAVHKTYPASATAAVQELDLVIERGEAFCLIGASGCGKTTTLRMINRLVEPTSGRIRVDGNDIATEDPIRLRRGMGYVIQRGGLFPHMTVLQNIELLCELEGWTAARRRARALETLERVRLSPDVFATRYPKELSGGESQRVGIARALVLDPPILLLDEPFGALDPITREELQDEFSKLRETVDKTILLVSHDLQEAFRLADRVGLMHAGRLIQTGTREDFRERPANDYVRRFVEGRVHAD